MTKTYFPVNGLHWWDLFPILGFALGSIAFYPGIMTPDTLDQLNQATLHQFNDWHPPLMAWIWSKMNLVFPESSGLLFLDLFLLWFGLFSIRRTIAHRFSPFVYLLGFLPFVIGLSGVIWKDVATAYTLLWAAIIMLRPKSRVNLVLFSLFVFAGIGIRYNSLFSCLPLIVGYFWLWFAQDSVRYRKTRVLVASGLFFTAQLVCLNLFNYHFLDTTRTTPQIVIMVDDLSYMSTQLGQSLVPGVDLDTIVRSNQQSVSDNVFRFNQPLGYQAVKSAWKAAIKAYPGLYLRFRSKVFLRFLGFSLAPPFDLDVPSREFWLDSSYQSQQTNVLRKVLGGYVKGAADALPFFYTGIFWLAVAAATFCLGVFTRLPYKVVTIALSLSCGINLMSYLLVANAPFFRYYYWSVIGGSLALFLLFAGFMQQRSRNDSVNVRAT